MSTLEPALRLKRFTVANVRNHRPGNLGTEIGGPLVKDGCSCSSPRSITTRPSTACGHERAEQFASSGWARIRLENTSEWRFERLASTRVSELNHLDLLQLGLGAGLEMSTVW